MSDWFTAAPRFTSLSPHQVKQGGQGTFNPQFRGVFSDPSTRRPGLQDFRSGPSALHVRVSSPSLIWMLSRSQPFLDMMNRSRTALDFSSRTSRPPHCSLLILTRRICLFWLVTSHASLFDAQRHHRNAVHACGVMGDDSPLLGDRPEVSGRVFLRRKTTLRDLTHPFVLTPPHAVFHCFWEQNPIPRCPNSLKHIVHWNLLTTPAPVLCAKSANHHTLVSQRFRVTSGTPSPDPERSRARPVLLRHCKSHNDSSSSVSNGLCTSARPH